MKFEIPNLVLWFIASLMILGLGFPFLWVYGIGRGWWSHI